MYLDCPPLGWMLADAKKKCRVKKGGVSWRIMSGLDVEI